VLAHRIRAAQSAARGDGVHREIGGLQQFPGSDDALVQQPLQRAHARLVAEPASQRPDAVVGVPGQVRERELRVEPLHGPGPGLGE
jgi:hypothetical protein